MNVPGEQLLSGVELHFEKNCPDVFHIKIKHKIGTIFPPTILV